MTKVNLEICVGTACHIMGAYTLVETIEELPDSLKGKINYKLSPCFEVCHQGYNPPIIKVNDKFYDNVTPNLLKEIIAKELGD